MSIHLIRSNTFIVNIIPLQMKLVKELIEFWLKKISPKGRLSQFGVGLFDQYWLNYWHILISKVRAVLRLILYVQYQDQLIYVAVC